MTISPLIEKKATEWKALMPTRAAGRRRSGIRLATGAVSAPLQSGRRDWRSRTRMASGSASPIRWAQCRSAVLRRAVRRLLRSGARRRPDSAGGLVHHAVAQVDDLRGQGPALEQLQSRVPLGLGEERRAAADQLREDPDPVLIDEVERGGLGG